MSPRARARPGRVAHGFTLIDLVAMITLAGIVSGGMSLLFTRLVAQSAAALQAHQAQRVVQALLEEVKSMPFTYCDPQDARAALATGAFLGPGGCATSVDGLGPEPGESRYAAANRFDGVSDYHGFTMPGPGCAGICDRDGAALPAPGTLAGCSLAVATTPQALPGLPALDANGRPQALRIVVTLRCPGSADVLAEAVRVRHAPNRF